jgi:hypothetical protein
MHQVMNAVMMQVVKHAVVDTAAASEHALVQRLH